MVDAMQAFPIGFTSVGLTASPAVNPLGSLQTLGTGTLAASLLGQGSAIVNLSAAGQLLSIADTFQSQLASFQPGATNSGIGLHFGDDLASLAAEAQFLVDAFNGAQRNLASLGGLGRSQGLAAAFTLALSNVSQETFTNGASALTQLAQLGINLEATAAGSSRLSVDLDTLKSAFASDPAGAFSLLAGAADAFRSAAADTVGQALGNFAAASILSQVEFSNQFFGSGSLFATGNGFNLADLLFLESLGGGAAGNANIQQHLLALNEFNLVSTLLG